jgi:PPOX class probable F420-dependent enzyme
VPSVSLPSVTVSSAAVLPPPVDGVPRSGRPAGRILMTSVQHTAPVPTGREPLSLPFRSVPRMPRTATAEHVDRDALIEFLRPRHRAVLLTRRRTGGVQLSPVTCGVDGEGRIVVSTYPQRAKAVNARRDPAVSVCVLSDDFDGPWKSTLLPPTARKLAAGPCRRAYYRAISGEHPDWAEYRAAMTRQGKALLRITPTGWGPVATGGFPPGLTGKD